MTLEEKAKTFPSLDRPGDPLVETAARDVLAPWR
jgi:hypothetical protein